MLLGFLAAFSLEVIQVLHLIADALYDAARLSTGRARRVACLVEQAASRRSVGVIERGGSGEQLVGGAAQLDRRVVLGSCRGRAGRP